MRAGVGDRVANVVFAVSCVGVAGAGALRYWPSAPAHLAREQIVEQGRPDPFGGSGRRLEGAILYVFVSSTCQPCRDSVPFYRRLVAAQAPAPGPVVFAGLEPEPVLEAFLRDEGIPAARVMSVTHPAGVPGTPTIVAIGSDGHVTRSWAGRLGPQQEGDVIALARGMPRVTNADSVDALLARVQARLRGSREVASVTAIDAAGTEASERGASTRTRPYEFALRLPRTLHLRMGPVVHTLDAGVYSSRLAESDRYGGPVVDQMMSDPETRRVAAHGMQSNLLRLSLAYFGRAPAADRIDDEGLRDFGQVKGRTLAFTNTAEKTRVEFVVDPDTAQPLAIVTPIRTVGGPADGADGLEIAVLGDYRETGGIRVPFRIDQWAGTTLWRLTLATVRVEGR
jgi:hypothetical protein